MYPSVKKRRNLNRNVETNIVGSKQQDYNMCKGKKHYKCDGALV